MNGVAYIKSLNRKLSWKKVVVIISSISAAIIFFITLFPELYEKARYDVYDSIGVDDPKLALNVVAIDGMNKEFSEYIGCPPGLYLPFKSHNLKYQDFIYSSPEHDLVFTISKQNPINKSPITITDLSIIITNVIPLEHSSLIISGECGGGETEKKYYIDKDEIESAVRLGTKFLQAKIDPDNKEPFDVVVLNNEDPEDYFRLKIPGIRNRIVGFKLRVTISSRGSSSNILSDEIYISNSEYSEKWLKEDKNLWRVRD